MLVDGVRVCLVPRDLTRLQAARGRRSYGDIAAAAGCSKSVVWELFNGRSRAVSADLAGRLEDAVGAPRGALFQLPPQVTTLIRAYAGDAPA